MKRIGINLITLLSLLLLCHCEKFVDVPLPETETVRGTVFSSNTTANAALVSIYAQMEVGSLLADITMTTGIMSDELRNYSVGTDNIQFYNNNVLPDNAALLTIWTKAYSYIYQCNSVIEGLQNSKLDQTFSNQLRGEALFLRSYLYFYLINLYGDVPLTLTSDYTQNSRIARSSVDVIYSKIVEDLTEAATLVGDNYLSPDGTSSSTSRFRANKNVVRAFLAKVMLFIKRYKSSDSLASIVISNSLYVLDTTLTTTFLNTSKEALLQIPNDSRKNSLNGFNFILTARPNRAAINNYKAFVSDSIDRRTRNWIGRLIVQVDTFYFSYKYKVASSATPTESLVLFRIAEQYLIRAESRNFLGDVSGAISDINIIRNRAGFGLFETNDPSSITKEIIFQRERELLCENGNRWLDIKRTGIVDSVMTAASVKKGTTWKKEKALLPIPASEIMKNSLLTQNTGY